MGTIKKDELENIIGRFDIESFGYYTSINTRENGNIGDEEYSEIDYEEAVEISKILSKDFNIKAKIDTCDEWVYLNFKNIDNITEDKLI